MPLKPRGPHVRIDSKRDEYTVDRGWPIEGHGTRNEILKLCWLGTVGFFAAMCQMFPRAEHRKTMADYLRTAADAIEHDQGLPWIKGKE